MLTNFVLVMLVVKQHISFANILQWLEIEQYLKICCKFPPIESVYSCAADSQENPLL